MCKEERTVEKHFYNNVFIRNFTITILSAIIILFVWQWRSFQNDFNSFKEETQDQVTRLEHSKTNLIELQEVEKDSLNYIFKVTDIEKINKNLNSLASEIYQERNKAEAIIDKDIDRLNLYMAMGIGFLALLGVFVPILVNILSTDELKKKQEEFQNKIERYDKQIKVIDSDISNINNKVDGIDKNKINKAVENSKLIDSLKKDSDDIIPKLSVISLQIAIHRLFNVSSLSLSKSREESKELYKKLFENIKDHLEQCQKDEKLNITNSEIMKQTLIDFADLINDESFKFTNYLTSRNIDEKILVKKLIVLSNSNENNQDENFTVVIQSFETFIEQITNKDA